VFGALQEIKKKYGQNDIYVTGSSLGAALAVVAGI
jgi:predicted lipase